MTDLPIGARVLAFHPEARAWRPATLRARPAVDRARVFFLDLGVHEEAGAAGASEHDVAVPEELEALPAAADFVGPDDESPRARAWRAMLHTLAVADPRVYGERRATAHLSPETLAPADVHALLVAAMLDADARIEGGASLLLRMRGALADYDPARMGQLGPEAVEAARRVMPSPLRARVLFDNARRFLELDAQPGRLLGWLRAQPDPVGALTAAFDRLEARAAVLFLRYLGLGTIAPDAALSRVAQRLAWVRRTPPPTPADVRDVWAALAREVGDAPALLDLTVRWFADGICRPEPQCERCAVAGCTFRRAESALSGG